MSYHVRRSGRVQRETKVRDVEFTIRIQQKIAGFDVAVEHTLFMRVLESLGGLNPQSRSRAVEFGDLM